LSEERHFAETWRDALRRLEGAFGLFYVICADMDPEQTFLRVHARLSGVLARLLTPKFRAVLEYLCLFNAVMLLALLVVMHVNFVAQVRSLTLVVLRH
jgi:hypothetical protein